MYTVYEADIFLFLFPLFVITNVGRKRLRRSLKVERNRDLNVNFSVSVPVNTKTQRIQRNKYSAVIYL